MIGTILGGRYEIIEEVGKGGMAYVYKARCTLLNRIVAVKILRDDLDDENELLKRFNVEAQAAASLTHANIVSIFDVGYDNGKHYIIMEYVDGITLKEYISEKVKLHYEEALSIAYQISDALQAAHQKNIVHRDIKPHNILITSEGQIKVTDFGIARSVTNKTLSSNDDILGSVHYISPEQAKGETVDIRSDIYSLGIVLHEMLTGRVPFDGDTPVAVAMKQIEERPSDIYFNELDTPLSIKQIVFKAMSKEPELRYQNAEEIKLDIINVLEDSEYVIADGFLYADSESSSVESDGAGKSKNVSRAVTNIAVKILLIIAALITSLVLVSSSVYVYINGIPEVISSVFVGEKITVPDLTGLTLNEAKLQCDNLNIGIVVDDEVETEDAAPGTIVSQIPTKDEKIKKADTVYVVINKSKEYFILEEYAGQNYKSIENTLENFGCNVNVIYEESKKDNGIILRQSPRSGKKVKKDSVVTLYVSKGINPSDEYVLVPNLIGKTYSRCSSTLTSSGLAIGYNSDQKPADDALVISQAIPSGSIVKKGCIVYVTVENASDEPDTGDSDETTSNNSDTEDGDISQNNDIVNNGENE